MDSLESAGTAATPIERIFCLGGFAAAQKAAVPHSTRAAGLDGEELASLGRV